MLELEFEDSTIRTGGAFGRKIDTWGIYLEEEKVGTLQVQDPPLRSNLLYIEDIYVRPEYRASVGTQGVRRLRNILKELYPNVTEVAGRRVSGARAGGEVISMIESAPLVRTRI